MTKLNLEDETIKKIILAIQHTLEKDKRVELVPTKYGLRVIAIERKEIKLNK